MKSHLVTIENEFCKNCGLCIIECKPNIISISKETNSMGYHPVFIIDQSLCTGCTLCAVACPDNVIEVFRKES